MKPIVLVVLNTLTLTGTLIMNYLGSTGRLTGRDVGEISDKYATLITPADYAFSIWGVIYLLLLLFVGFQWYLWLKENRAQEINDSGLFFTLANLANAGWIVVWVSDLPGLSVLLMLALLVCLSLLVVRNRLELWDAPMRIILFVWWPITLYFGWIIVATVTNLAAWLVSLGWQGGALGEPAWTIMMLIAATLIYLGFILTRNLREAAFVGVWAFVSIGLKLWETVPSVAFTAFALATLLFLGGGIHAFLNRDTAPGAKIARGEWR